jgi:hypothetical protein
MTPRRISGWPSFALAPATRKSQHKRELAAAAEGVSGDRGDGRLRDRRDGAERGLQAPERRTMSVYDMVCISLMSAPAANTRSPP